ncbi:hypothetical protein CEUSTIGMA_g7794.t1 [Chlamydomonas eustigma]|uniref:MPN domain-containing protein n=1 Tax=Chlamydomonas eustigma TaxID=1157962 RepID=A0A250XB84_9CHLO|nr:hypothetical protein CEUSTIGMA_g7794.t1 [Chlamydomonas eustigma]|eukprot:GAX80355.1 hypothetical protein CEUSTIGMA_g7794.t1 [Chlamydomonas eustigma]
MPAPRKLDAPPSKTEQLAAQARLSAKPLNNNIDINRYYLSVAIALKQAQEYRLSLNEEQLFVMLMRVSSLLVEKIPQHKGFTPKNPTYTLYCQDLRNKIMPELEALKLSLNTKEGREPVAQSRNRPPNLVQLSVSDLPQMNWSSSHPSQQMNVQDLLDIISPSAATMPSQAATQSTSSCSTSTLPAYQPKYTSASQQGQQKHTLFFNGATNHPTLSNPERTSEDVLRYPQVLIDELPSPSMLTEAQMRQLQIGPSAGPNLGPQEVEVLSMSVREQAGAPGSCSDPCPPPLGPLPPAPTAASGGPKELVKRAALRDVHVSVALMDEFLKFAIQNTSRGIETCGILAGSLSGNDSIFTINTLIIPKQKGTSDTVEMLGEEDVLMVHLEKELYPLGWIHTHPTQSCFLSSVDVHTQSGYQTMLDEAVAIVLAPKDRANRCGIFRLTTPGGLSLIQGCERRGFHMHPSTSTGQEIYELCGHVFLTDRAKHEVVDLRN